jgi:Bacterial transcription activator, effector binding domain.
MNELVKFEVVKLPKLWIIGKELRYSDAALNHGDNRLPAFWDKCYKESVFTPLEAQSEYIFNTSHAGVFLDWYLGDGDFSYVVGMLMKEGVTVPEGYFARELAETDAALCWVKCKSIIEIRTVPFESTAEAIEKIERSYTNMKWCADLYHSARSTIANEDGDVILDCYIPLD